MKSSICVQKKNLILYAVWEQTITEIRFDANGGSGGTTGTSVIFGEYLSSNALSAPGRNGYLFDGYYTEIDGGEKIFDAEMNVSGFYAVNAWNQNTETLILYAHWAPIAYTVVYFSGTKTLSVQEVFTIRRLILRLLLHSASNPKKGIISPVGRRYRAVR